MRYFLFLCFFSLSLLSYGQRGDDMAPTQWWLGVNIGMNGTSASPIERFQVLNSMSPKTYENESEKYGYKIGMEGSFDFLRYFALSVQPSAKLNNFGYNSTRSWSDSTNETNTLSAKYEHDLTLTYLDFPLFLKFEYRSRQHGESGGTSSRNLPKHSHSGNRGGHQGTWVPYVQGGAFYSVLIAANKDISTELEKSGITTTEAVSFGVKERYLVSQYGFLFGAGIAYDFKSMRIAADFNYRISTHNITNQQERFANEQLVTEHYDVPDDIRLSSWEAQLHVVFPMKFIVSGNFSTF